MKSSISTYLTITMLMMGVNVMIGDDTTGRNSVLLKMQMDALSNKAHIYTHHYTMHYQQVKMKLAKISS